MQSTVNSARRGISLIEVLMSIFIISVGILGVAALLPLAHLLTDRGTTADRASLAGKSAAEHFKIYGMHNPNYWLNPNGTAADPAPARVCIDPRGVARGITAAFPISVGMPRITLRQAPGVNTIMATKMADELFEFKDDLGYLLNEADATTPPAQLMYSSASSTPEKRFNEAQYSWLATLVRQAGTDRYTMSAVVIQGRGNNLAVTDETVHQCDFTSTLGGGEVVLGGAPASVGKGNWIMVFQGDLYQWYRITALDRATMRATLAGRDWTGTASPPPQALIMPGVVGVYERTIRLDATNSF